MGLFEDSIAAGMHDREFATGWIEAEAELSAYYASLVPQVTAAPEYIVSVSFTGAVGEQRTKTLFPPAAPYSGFVAASPLTDPGYVNA
jgi:hypothetical protein